ncbi:MAG: 50S ribosomal protein L15 [Phycisphaerales bacterium]|nr:MAG: 50S ribosomal protein L15 [Phycisphaerales bacterium]
MNLTEITRQAGRHRRRKRVGRGRASGRGKTSTRGHKGSGSRAGWKSRGFAEGGQMPLFRRLPKRGFSNVNFTTRYSVVNLHDLQERFSDGDLVNLQVLIEARLVRNERLPVKVLGDGTLTKKLTVEAAKFSRRAADAITAAGGQVRVI